MTDFYEKIRTGTYENKLPYVSSKENPKASEAWFAEAARVADLFQADVLDEVGLKNHPRAHKAFSLAWQQGHANGHSEVFSHLLDIAELLLND